MNWEVKVMSIEQTDQIDGMAVDGEGGEYLRLLITDHLEWQESASSLSEYDHMSLLQDKINTYLSFLETEQYKEHYPDSDFTLAIIEIHFKYGVTENCEKFLQTVQDQVGQHGIKIEALALDS
jgi:hypothetical protein